MIVLSRRIGEKLMIDGKIQITFVDCNPHGQTVKLGITAPKETTVWRQELHDVIVEQQRLESDDRQAIELP